MFLGILAGRRGRQQHRVFIEVGHDCASSLLGQAPGLEPDRPSAVGAVVDGGFGELNFWTLFFFSPLVCSFLSADGGFASLLGCFFWGGGAPPAGPPRGRC